MLGARSYDVILTDEDYAREAERLFSETDVTFFERAR